MTDAVPRAVVEAFYEAYAARDIDRVVPFIDDDVQWTISGPVDVLPFCGTRRGKAALLDLLRRVVPEVFAIYRFVIDTMVIDGDRVATFNRLSARMGDDGRVISYRLGFAFSRRTRRPVRETCPADILRSAGALGRRAVGGGQRRRGHGAGRIDGAG